MDKTMAPTIFVVEDNLLYQQLIAKELESFSTCIYFFTKGESCLTALAEKQPEIIVLDYNLEGAMTGLDTLGEIRDRKCKAYVVLFTTECGLNNAENFKRYGMFDFVEKREAAFHHLKETIAAHQSQFVNSSNTLPTIGMKKLSLIFHNKEA